MNYFSNVRYNFNEALLSEMGTRPKQQCRLISDQLAMGQAIISSKYTTENKVCYSCHRLALSVPYL